MSAALTKKLNINSTQKILSGYEMPVLGYGLYQVPWEIAGDLTEKALSVGYRHIDSAAAYRNERQGFSGVQKAGLQRSDVFLTTKVPPKAVGYEAAKQSIEGSLEAAEVDYFDLILLHSPFGGKEGRLGSWRALVEAQKADELEQYIQNGGGGKIEVGQYELHPWLARSELVDWLRKRGTVIEAYSPLARGTRLNEPVLKKLGEKHNKTPAQILIRWSLQKGFVPLPKSVTADRIQENADVFDFELDEDDMKLLHTDDYSPSTWDPTVHHD
ncbi:hypothetical protein BBP40_007408 [Aspergillus hancockii]|nr:hypothetical protein BBP40_007408 [Aspergillus hancockii]